MGGFGGLPADPVETALAEAPWSGSGQGAALPGLGWGQTAGCRGLCEGTAFLLMIFT